MERKTNHTVRELYITYTYSSLAMFKISLHVPLKRWIIFTK